MNRRAWLIGCLGAAGVLAGAVTAADLVGTPGAATAAISSAPSTLFTGQTLAPGGTLNSPDGRYIAEMTPSGAFVVSIANPYGTPRPIWSTGTGSDTGATLSLPTSGDLSVLDTSGNPVWGANETADGCANLDMQPDGDLVLYGPDGAYWESGSEQHTMEGGDELLPGQVIFGSGGDYDLTMNPAGYLEIVDSAGVVWKSPGSVPGSYARVTGPGNFEIISPTGTYEWTAPVSSAVAGDVLDVWANGGIAVVNPSGTTEWSSGTDTARSGLAELNGAQAYQSCPPATTIPPPPPPTVTTTTTTTATTTTTTPVTTSSGTSTKPPALANLRVGIELEWHYRGNVSYVKSAHVKRFPKRAMLRVSCRGSTGCPMRTERSHGHRHRVRRSLSAGHSDLHRTLARLTRLRFHAGDRVVFTVTERHHRTVRSEAVIRRGRPPLDKRLRKLSVRVKTR